MATQFETIQATLDQHQLDGKRTEKANFGTVYCLCGWSKRTFKGISALLTHQAQEIDMALAGREGA